MAAAATPNVKLLFGPMLIGTYLNTILFGILLIQVFIYYRTYRKDATWLRYFILFLFIAETLNTGFDIAMMYEPLILNYATPEATTFFPHFLAADPFMTVIISTPIQIFIAWRIKIISRSWWISTIICVLSLISFGGGIWLTHTVTIVRRFAKKPELHWPALTWLLASAIADVIITIALTVSLSRRKTGFSSTDDTINKIIRLTVQTGLITAIFAILDVVCFLVLPHAAINFVWDFALSKLYSNALMSTLNARAGWENLANGHNLLFGSDGSGRRTLETFVSTNFRAPPVSDFELSSRSRSKGDIEFGMGISMTSKGDETITTQEPELGFGPPNAESLTQ